MEAKKQQFSLDNKKPLPTQMTPSQMQYYRRRMDITQTIK
jgi:hypothetical protein